MIGLNQFEVLTKAELIQRLHSYFSDKEIKMYTEVLESLEWTSQTQESEFHQKVKSILTDISKGRFYQINLTSYFKASLTQTIDPLFVFYYFFEKYKDKSKRYLFINSIFLVFYIQYIDSLSPNLPILVFLSIIFYTFIFSKMNEKQIKKALEILDIDE